MSKSTSDQPVIIGTLADIPDYAKNLSDSIAHLEKIGMEFLEIINHIITHPLSGLSQTTLDCSSEGTYVWVLQSQYNTGIRHQRSLNQDWQELQGIIVDVVSETCQVTSAIIWPLTQGERFHAIGNHGNPDNMLANNRDITLAKLLTPIAICLDRNDDVSGYPLLYICPSPTFYGLWPNVNVIYNGDGQFSIEHNNQAFLNYWCEIRGICGDDDNLLYRWSWFMNAASAFNISEFTHMSPEALATLVYSKVSVEDSWDTHSFSGRSRSFEGFLDFIATRVPLSAEFNEWIDRKRPWRLQGFSLGLPNFFLTQAIDALIWWDFLQSDEYRQAVHGITIDSDWNELELIMFGENQPNQYEDVSDLHLSSNMSSIYVYTLISVWNAWRYYSNRLDLASNTEAYNLEDIYENFYQEDREGVTVDVSVRNSISIFAVQMTTFTDTPLYATSLDLNSIRGEIVKALVAVEIFQRHGVELGFDLVPSRDFLSYTDEDVNWLIDILSLTCDNYLSKLTVADLDPTYHHGDYLDLEFHILHEKVRSRLNCVSE